MTLTFKKKFGLKIHKILLLWVLFNTTNQPNQILYFPTWKQNNFVSFSKYNVNW